MAGTTALPHLTAALLGTADVLLPLPPHAQQTLAQIARAAAHSTMRLSPLCHEDPHGQKEVRGWVLDTPMEAPAEALPINCCLFDGVTVVRCDCSEADVLDLMRAEDDTRARLGAAVRAFLRPHPARRASWGRCHPTANGHPPSLHAAVASGGKGREVSFFQAPDDEPLVDSEPWEPELSPEGFVGLFHHWHHGPARRRLCLYAVCQSYLPKACLEFADTVRALGDECSASTVCLSLEAEWLRTACARNRAAIIARVCTAMGIRYPGMRDYHAAAATDPARPRPLLAAATTETLHHDLHYLPAARHVRVLNYCSQTQSACNGTACVMAPWDGVWVFHGAEAGSRHVTTGPGSSSVGADFGRPHGAHFLPTTAPRVADLRPTADTPLAFTSADPDTCPLLRTWGPPRCAAAGRTLHVRPAFAPAGLDRPGGAEAVALDTDGLDPDVAAAYRRSIARQSVPDCIVLPDAIPGAFRGAHTRNYLTFDEAVLASMARRGWCRAHGYTALIPLACALAAHAPDDDDGPPAQDDDPP